MNKTTRSNQSMLILIIYGLILIATFFVTQTHGMGIDDQDKKKKFKDEYLDEVESSVNEMSDWGVNLGFDFNTDRSLGFKYDDLDYQDVFEKKYDQDFGVKIYKIYDDSPAYKAGLMIGDILMCFGSDTIHSEDELDNIIENLKDKDKVNLTYFRNGEEFKTIMYLEKSTDDEFFHDDITLNFNKKHKKYKVGLFGMYWSPSFIINDYSAANDLLADLDFADNQIEQLWFNEFGFKFYVGKNTFLGMVFSGADAEGTTKLTLAGTGDNISRKMQFEHGMWGFTLDKRYRPLKRTMFSSGFFIGRGKSILTIHQQNGEINWDELWSDGDKFSNNDYIKIKKLEFVFEPRVSVMHRMVGPFWLKLEAGYMLGYSNKHWRDITTEDEYVIANSPQSSLFQGFTFTISPWIGF